MLSTHSIKSILSLGVMDIGVAVTSAALMMFIALYHRYGSTNWDSVHEIRKQERGK